jgi:hypothetical protein
MELGPPIDEPAVAAPGEVPPADQPADTTVEEPAVGPVDAPADVPVEGPGEVPIEEEGPPADTPGDDILGPDD